MLTRIFQVGTSVGIIIPWYIALECGFTKGSSVNIEYSNDRIIISKPGNRREGWGAAFARYAREGEDELMLPDYLDAEAE